MIHHLVVLQLKKSAKPAQIAGTFAALAGLREKVPGLLSFAGGAYSSPEGLNQGFTHGFTMTFRDRVARDGYLTHPEHEEVKARILPLLAKGLKSVVAFDFEA